MRTGTIAVAFMAVLFAAPWCRGDTILLTNGNVIEGRILEEGEKEIKILIPITGAEEGITMSFKRSRIRTVRRGGGDLLKKQNAAVDMTSKPQPKPPKTDTVELFDEDEEKRKKREQIFGGTEDSEAKEEEADKKDEEKKDAAEPKPLDPALKAKIEELLQDFEAIDEAVRAEAVNHIVAIGQDATPVLVTALRGDQKRKTLVIEAIARIGDKRATKELIKNLKLARVQAARMKAAYQALVRITGQSFPFHHQASPAEREAEAKKWEEWLKSVEEDEEYAVQF